AQRAKSSSKFPMEIFSAIEALKNAAGRAFLAASKPFRAKRFRSDAGASGFRSGGTISSSTHGKPAFAKCAAMRAPIVPAPKTTAFCMARFIRRPSFPNLYAAVQTLGKVTKPPKRGQTFCSERFLQLKIGRHA